ncbi:hypothetical protein BDV35DRAFT_9298 [Aspergillus flavus]|uniref:Uncharacterized protein n=1 Tax=Aspergillus flavus TaxID=5059 RepID=A0A5N6HCG1_ASPFL|nr:hypothetical protein BDV35DRAFT_9298 [Aspergillus flavus]
MLSLLGSPDIGIPLDLSLLAPDLDIPNFFSFFSPFASCSINIFFRVFQVVRQKLIDLIVHH